MVPDLSGARPMTTIDVRCSPIADGVACAVVVTDDTGSSSFEVTASDVAFADHVRLVRETFEFLLEREPRTAILPKFDLSVVRRYFPDYDDEIARRMRRPGR